MIQSKSSHIIVLIGAIAFCVFVCFLLTNLKSFLVLVVFNFFFGTLIFQLNGTTVRKIGLLLAGNVVGVFWNFVFLHFSLAGAEVFGKTFDALYTIIYPFLNLIWVVSYWSLTLSVMPSLGKLIETSRGESL